jgi:Zn-dependent protease
VTQAETRAAAPPPATPSPGSQLAWNVISTALLAGWIALRMGWIWALAGVVGVFVHEFGHVLAMNALGSGPARIRIVPFLGGAAIPRTPPSTEFKGVLIALAGPLFGLLAMAPFFGAYVVTGQDAWLGGAFFVAVLNLLNLLPAPPLDGSKAIGPALAFIHPWVEKGALAVIGAAAVLWAVLTHNWILGIFVGLGVLGSLRQGRLRPSASRLSVPQWLVSIVLYVAAFLVCIAAVELALTGAGLESSLRPILRMFGGAP